MATATEAPADAAGLTSHTHFPDGRQRTALDTLREPFTENQISKLPKVTCSACTKAQYKVCERHERRRCDGCGGNLTTQHIHLDYVGHAELTGRLLQADLLWQWEPLAFDADGLPKFDNQGGLWIRLTVGGHTRLGYGDSQGKTGPNAVKEAIGDALRNAAMRFGAALNLWSKTDMDAANAAKESLSREPTDQDRIADLHGLMVKRWDSLGGLRNVRALVTSGGFESAEVQDADGGTRKFAEMLDERIDQLATPKPPAPPASVPAAVPAPEQMSAAQAGPPSADSPETAELDKLLNQAQQHWGKPIILEQIKGAAAKAGLVDHNVQGPPDWDGAWMGFGALLDRRLNELKTAANDAPGRAA